MNQYLDIADEKRMLSEIAAKNFEVDRLFFSEGEILAQIREFGKGNANTPPTFNAPKILETILIDQGLFVERVRGSYSFSHLTFQEYLTANYIERDTRSIKGLVKKHLHNDQWREVFLLTAGLMHEADDLLTTMEAEAAKLINTDLKSLFGWAEQITGPADDRYSRHGKRVFAIRQYFLLCQLNKFHETVKYKNRDSQNFYPNLGFYLYRTLDQDIYLDIYSNRYQNRSINLYIDLLGDRGISLDQDLHSDLDRYLNQVRHFSFDLLPYHDFYRYMDAHFHSSDFSKFGGRFDKELSARIKIVERTKETQIFKGADLQRMVQRFNEEREFIKAIGKEESVEPPMESIHDTWLAVLGITDNMLAISDEELENCYRYLRAVELIVACKEAAGRVSPKVWQQIEERLLA